MPCHPLQEIYRVLKPGGLFAGYEWCSTDLNDPSNPTHKSILDEIELGNGLPDIRSTREVRGIVINAVFVRKTQEPIISGVVHRLLAFPPYGHFLSCSPSSAIVHLLPLQVEKALKDAGFEMQEVNDLAVGADIPWCVRREEREYVPYERECVNT